MPTKRRGEWPEQSFFHDPLPHRPNTGVNLELAVEPLTFVPNSQPGRPARTLVSYNHPMGNIHKIKVSGQEMSAGGFVAAMGDDQRQWVDAGEVCFDAGAGITPLEEGQKIDVYCEMPDPKVPDQKNLRWEPVTVGTRSEQDGKVCWRVSGN